MTTPQKLSKGERHSRSKSKALNFENKIAGINANYSKKGILGNESRSRSILKTYRDGNSNFNSLPDIRLKM